MKDEERQDKLNMFGYLPWEEQQELKYFECLLLKHRPFLCTWFSSKN